MLEGRSSYLEVRPGVFRVPWTVCHNGTIVPEDMFDQDRWTYARHYVYDQLFKLATTLLPKIRTKDKPSTKQFVRVRDATFEYATAALAEVY